jgi:hypothetical protein
MANTNGKAKKFRIRISGFEQKPASQFKFNPLNYRRHGDAQRDALRTMLGDVGWVQGVIENKRTGNLIDGHARIEEALRDDPKQSVPYLIVDLSPAEEKAVLATLDPIGAMAEVDQATLDLLYRETILGMPGMEQLLNSLHYETDGNGAGADGAGGIHPLLKDRFIVPPFSVLDARQGYWQVRKRAWIDLGIQSELGRGDGLLLEAKEVTTENLNYYRNRASPGGSPRPACNYKNKKRGDGRGREI